MARLDMNNGDMALLGGDSQADIFRVMGLMYAIGRDCEKDLVAAHKWLNIAAIKGCDKAERLRAELMPAMSKAQIARALREAREWMTAH